MQYVQPVGGLANDPYLDANPVGGIEGSPVPAAAIEHPMRELVALITDAGLAPTGATLTQVATAVRALMQRQAASISVAGGTADAITAAYTPVIGALVNGMTLHVRAASVNTTAAPTFTPASPALAAKAIVKGNNLPLVAGDIAGAGHWLELRYDATLDKWVIANPATGVLVVSVASIQGQFKNLQASATGLSANVSVTCDEIAVESGGNAYQTLRAVNLTISGAASGVANGLDTGALAVSTWYSLWVISNGVTTAGLMSLSATAPTLPGGYTHKARVGWVRTDASGNKYPLGFRQFGRKVNYAVAAGSNLAALPIMAGGVAGSVSTPTWVAVATGAYVPPTASHISVNATVSAGNSTIVAPNNSYGGSASTTNQPPLVLNIAGYGTQNCVMPIESSNIYWASGAATGQLTCFGWEDNL